MTLFMAALALFLPNQMPEPAARDLYPAPAPASATETPPVVRMPPMSTRRPCARGCLSPVEAVTYATYLASIYANPEFRFDAVNIKLESLSSANALIIAKVK